METGSVDFNTLSVIGELLARPDVLTRGQWNIPAIRRLVIYFEGGDGVSQITGCELFGEKGSQSLESDDAELLLETRIPLTEDQEPVAIGRLLDGAVLTLLNIRRTGWTEGEGSGDQADIRWRGLPNGEILAALGASLQSY